MFLREADGKSYIDLTNALKICLYVVMQIKKIVFMVNIKMDSSGKHQADSIAGLE